VSAELDATATIAALDGFVGTPKPGTQWLTVTVSISNKSAQAETWGSNLQLVLLRASGVAIDQSYSCLANATDALESAQMQPGATLTGRLCFEVPTAEVPGLTIAAQPQFSTTKTADQRFLAIQ
jgi:hypothetical protein